MASLSYGGWISRDGKIIFLEKTVRTIPYGFLGVVFAVYLDKVVGLNVFAIGVVLTLTVLSSALYAFIISFMADRIGRKKTLVFFALTDVLAGSLLLISTEWWAPVLAGVVGNMRFSQRLVTRVGGRWHSAFTTCRDTRHLRWEPCSQCSRNTLDIVLSSWGTWPQDSWERCFTPPFRTRLNLSAPLRAELRFPRALGRSWSDCLPCLP